MKIRYATKDVGKIWNNRLFLHPNLHALGEDRHAINPHTFSQKVRNKFFPLSTDLDRVETEFIGAMNRGSETLNFLMEEYLSPEDARLSQLFAVGHLPAKTNVQEFIQEARRRYRSLMDSGNTDRRNKRPLYEVVRGIEIGYQILRTDTEIAVQLSLRHYKTIIEWFNEFLGIRNGIHCSFDSFDYAFPTNMGIDVYGHENEPFRSRLKYLTPEGKIKYGSLLMKTYLALLEHDPKNKKGATSDYTGVEFIVKNDQDVELLVEGFRETSPIWILEKFKQRKRMGERTDNAQASTAFGLTKFVIRVPILVDQITGHPLGDLTCQLVPVEVQILTIEDHHIRGTHPDALHESYKHRQFMRLFPAFFPRSIYEPFL